MIVLNRIRAVKTGLRAAALAVGVLCFTTLGQINGAKAAETRAGNAIPPIAFAARVIGDSSRARLIVDFDQDVFQETYLLDNPKRIVVDLPETVFSLDGELKRLPKSLVSNLRYGTIADGRSRIVLELAQPVLIENHRVKELSDDNRFRLIVDLVKATQEQFSSSVRPPVRPKSALNENKSASKKQYVIVIDPGHGGIDGGASGSQKTREKEITLSFAKKLKALLASNKLFKPLLTRDGDEFMRLTERVEKARKYKADLLISVHADSLRQKDIRGATIYTLSKKGSDEISRTLANSQNRTDLIAGLSLPEEKPDVSNILIDMTRRETKVFSERFASVVVRALKDDIKLIKNPLRSADFYVLKAPEIPSILLELGYLSNRRDEALMRSDEWQSIAVHNVYDAIREFFDVRVGTLQ